MAEEPQFHITVVTQQRRQRSDGAQSSRRSAHRHRAAQTKTEASGSAQTKAETSAAASAQAAHPSSDRSAHSDSHRRSHSGSHRRRYKDYGTVNLGSLGDNPEEEEVRDFTADPNGPTPTQGELQRQFYNKYNAILNRRYFTRNRNKVTRVILIALLVAVIFLVSIFGINAIRGNVAETLEAPEMSTIPVGTLDLGR